LMKKDTGFAPPDWFFNVAGAAMAVVCSMVAFGLPLLAMKIGASVFELGMVGTMGPLCYNGGLFVYGADGGSDSSETDDVIGRRAVRGVLWDEIASAPRASQ